jgi:hypothetical protein
LTSEVECKTCEEVGEASGAGLSFAAEEERESGAECFLLRLLLEGVICLLGDGETRGGFVSLKPSKELAGNLRVGDPCEMLGEECPFRKSLLLSILL